MKVVCINCSKCVLPDGTHLDDQSDVLTVGKVYHAIEFEGTVVPVPDYSGQYYVFDDVGRKYGYNKSRFSLIEDVREERLNKLLDNEKNI